MAGKEKVQLLNAGYTNVDREQLLDLIMQDLNCSRKASVVFLNVDVVMKLEKDAELAHIVEEAEYVMADGMPLIWISKLFGRPLKEKVSGSDFIPQLCERASREKKSIFLAGGAENVAEHASRKLKDTYPGIRIAGTYSPPFGFEKKPDEVKKMNEIIAEASPDIAIICLGCPKQEKYIYENRDSYSACISVCGGATIDFLAGNVKRCPPWMSKCGLEWFFRFLQEPKRLFKRYFVDDMKIAGLVLKYWKNQSRGKE